jgi:tRNA(adenine34) deaminase
MTQSDIDIAMMRRCIALSATATEHGDLPIGCLLCDGEEVLAEGTNEVRKTGDVTRHAEVVAMTTGSHAHGRRRLAGATLYATVEPCPMCSFAARELNIARVVYALGSPVMGGVSKWNVMRDTGLSDVIPEVFGAVPEVVAGLLWQEAAAVWRRWNPLIWAYIRHRGCFAPAPAADGGVTHMEAIPSHGGWLHSLLTPGKGI